MTADDAVQAAFDAMLRDARPRFYEIMNRQPGYGQYHAATRHYAALILPMLDHIAELERELKQCRRINDKLFNAVFAAAEAVKLYNDTPAAGSEE